MHLEALKIFCDVVRHQSFSRGALANNVSQSAASQAVHQLEKRLGKRLIDRSKRPWVLTDEGRFFHAGCNEIVQRYQALELAVRDGGAASNYKVHVAAIYSVGLSDMGQYVDQFSSARPGASVHLEYIHPEQVYDRVRQDQVDLGLISFARHSREFTVTPWRDEEMVVACLPDHEMTREPFVDPGRLAGEPFVRFERRLPIRRELDRFLRQHSVDVKVVAEFDNIPTMKQAVEDGAGIAILPEPTFRREVERGVLAMARFRGAPFLRPLSIIHRRKRDLNKAVQEFVNLLLGKGGAAEATEARAAHAEGVHRTEAEESSPGKASGAIS